MENDVLEFSADAIYTKDIFYFGLNDVNFYFEDTGKEYIYEKLLDKLFNYKISSIFCIGGKENIKKKFKDMRENNPNEFIKSVFIVDDDFDILLSRDIYSYDNFLYLGKYNFEAFLFEKNAINNLLSTIYGCTKKEILKKFNYELWYGNIVRSMEPFVKLFSVSKKVNAGFKIFDYAIIDKNANIIIEKYNEMLKIFSSKIPDYKKEIKDIENRINELYEGSIENVLCGKFLLRSFTAKMYSLPHKDSMSDNIIICTLIDNIDKSVFNSLIDRVNEYLKKNRLCFSA